MSSFLKSSLVSIQTSNREIVGAGFLVSEDLIVTCAHVVRDALQLNSTPGSAPESEILLDFPFLAPGKTVAARVIHWDPRKPDGTGDIAGLRLNGFPPPTSNPIQLIAAETENMKGCNFSTFGFPRGQDQGAFAYGVIKDVRPGGTVHLEDTKTTGKPIESGFSGGPVWVESEQQVRVVGMIGTADVKVRTTKVAYMIPISKIAESWKELGVLKSAPPGRIPSELKSEVFITPNITLPGAVAPIQDVQEIVSYLIDDHTPIVVFVVGEFGTGKTQLMAKLWSELCTIWQQDVTGSIPIPFFYDLSSRPVKNLEDYLLDARKLQTWSSIGQLSTPQNCLFLLDSLDEISRTSWGDELTGLMLSIRDHAMKSSAPRVIIACRRSFYDELLLSLDGLQEDKPYLEIGELEVDFWRVDQILGYFSQSNATIDSIEDLRRFIYRHQTVVARAIIASFVVQNIERFEQLSERGELTVYRIFHEFFYDQLYAWANKARVETVYGEQLVFLLEEFIEALAVALLQQGDDNQHFPRRKLLRKLNVYLEQEGFLPSLEQSHSSVNSLLGVKHQRELIYRQVTTRSLLELNDDRKSYRFCHQSVWEFIIARLYIRYKLAGREGSLEAIAYMTLRGSHRWYSTIYNNFIRDQEEVAERQSSTRPWIID